MWPWLSSMGRWVVRLVGGWLPIGTKPISEWLGKILWVSGCIAIGLIIYNKLTTQANSPKQTVGDNGIIITHYHQPKATFGCVSTRVIEYTRALKAKTTPRATPKPSPTPKVAK